MRASLKGLWAPGIRAIGAVHLLLLGGFIALAYFPSLHGEFVFDDIENIVINPVIQPQSFGEIARALDSRLHDTRPVAMVSFAFNYWLGAHDTYGYHLFNVVLHVLNALLLYAISLGLLRAVNYGREEEGRERLLRQVAFWAVLLWAVHPVQTQAVSYIVQRMTLLAALFHFGALLAYVMYRQGQMKAPAAAFVIGVYFVFGMLSKEIAVVIPLSLIALHYLVFSRDRTPRLWPVLLAAVAMAAVGIGYLDGRLPDIFERYPRRDFSGFERLLTEPRVLVHYLSLYFFPYLERLHVGYDIAPSRGLWQPATTLFSILGVAVLFIGALVMRRRLPLLAFAVVFFFFASSVEASFLSLELAFVHRLYIPSAFLLLGLLASVPLGIYRRSTLLLGLILVLLMYTTLLRNEEWRTAARLWAADVERGAAVDRAVLNTAMHSIRVGQIDEAVKLMDGALPHASGLMRMRLLAARGYVDYIRHDYDRCIETNEQVLREFGHLDSAHLYAGLCYLGRGEEAGALGHITRLREYFGSLAQPLVLNAEYARRIGRPDIAEYMLRQAIDDSDLLIDDQVILARLHLANLYLDEQRFQEAYDIYQEIVRRDPANYFAWIQLYRMQRAAGDTANAENIRRFLEERDVRIPDDV